MRRAARKSTCFARAALCTGRQIEMFEAGIARAFHVRARGPAPACVTPGSEEGLRQLSGGGYLGDLPREGAAASWWSAADSAPRRNRGRRAGAWTGSGSSSDRRASPSTAPADRRRRRRRG